MSGYYPEGVTGNEPQIAGWPNQSESNDEREVSCWNDECEDFEVEVMGKVYVEIWGNRLVTNERVTYVCPKCNYKTETEKDYDTEEFYYQG